MAAKIGLVLVLAVAVAQINAHPGLFGFGKKDKEATEEKSLFGLPSFTNPIKGAVEAIQENIPSIQDVQEKMSLDGVKDAMGGLPIPSMDAVKDVMGELPIPSMDSVKDVMGELPIPSMDKVNEVMGDLPIPAMDKVKDAMGDLPIPSMDDVKDKMSLDGLKNTVEKIKEEGIVNVAKEKIDEIKETAEGTVEKIVPEEVRNVADKVKENLNLDTITNPGAIIDLAKDTVEGVANKVVSPLEGLKEETTWKDYFTWSYWRNKLAKNTVKSVIPSTPLDGAIDTTMDAASGLAGKFKLG